MKNFARREGRRRPATNGYVLITDEAASKAVDVYGRRDDVEGALHAALQDEPDEQNALHVEKAVLAPAWSPN